MDEGWAATQTGTRDMELATTTELSAKTLSYNPSGCPLGIQLPSRRAFIIPHPDELVPEQSRHGQYQCFQIGNFRPFIG